MQKGLKLFKLFGIDVRIHVSWWIIFGLITWSLATSFFPLYFEGYSSTTYWGMGIAAALLLFISVLLHELSHSLVARAKNIKVESITLFFFGGVAGITDEDMKPSSEFLMAIAGPLFSFVLAGIFFGINIIDFHPIVTAITFYLYQLNFILAIFNLVPGYPLDGGRAFRAILRAYYKDIVKATKIASMGGRVVAGVLIISGLISIFSGLANGLWFVLLGGFLFFIAKVSYEQVVVKQVLIGVSLKDVMVKTKALSPTMKFTDFVKKNVRGEDEIFLVSNSTYTGILDLRRVQKLPKKMQDVVELKQVSLPLHQFKPIKKSDTAYAAFRLLNEQSLELLPVMAGKKVLGVVSKDAITHRLIWNLNYGYGRSGKSMAKRAKKYVKKKKTHKK